MKRFVKFAVTALTVVHLFRIPESRAEASSCASIHRTNLVPCALAGSLPAQAERQSLEAAEARQEAAKPILPNNPVLKFSAARRSTAGISPVVNWYATLSQEIEIGGQRSARQKVADAEHQAQEKIVQKTDREIAAAAWRAYFEALAAREDVRLSEQIEIQIAQVATTTRAAADKGLISEIDADVVDAAHLRAIQDRLAATRRAQITKTALLAVMSRDTSTTVNIEGDLVPLADIEVFAAKQEGHAIEKRPEIQALEAVGKAQEARIVMHQRARIPNPTLSVFVQNDGFNERVFGAEISLPIPLPQPLGRTNAGEIAEAKALSRRAKIDVEQARREVRADLANARATFAAVRGQSDLYTDEKLEKAKKSLQAIASEIEAGRLAVRDSFVSQQALVDLLRASLEAKKNLALASVDLAVAAGYPLEKGAP